MTDNRTTLWAPIQTPADLGQFLRRLRHERGWSQQRLAEELGTTRQYVFEIESGKPNLYSDRLFAALRLLGGALRAERRSQ